MDLNITSKHLIVALAAWGFSLSALAQYQWVGKDGRKVFSDRPPPAEIQEKDILKQPGGRRAPAPVAAAAPADTAGPAAAAPAGKAKADPNAPKISGKDADLQARKKKLEDEENARKKIEDEKFAKSQADNCERARKAAASYRSGERLVSTNAKGEREILDDAAKAEEIKRVQSVIDRDCS
jgi:hypothetical protein